jgi:peptidyl-prolyl cis-trans isomerase C
MIKKSSLGYAIVCATLLAFPAVAQEPNAETVVATVNGADITLGHLLVLRKSLPEQYQSLPDEVLFKGLLDQLVQQTALEQSLGDTLTRLDTLTVENERRTYLSGVALQSVIAGAVTDQAVQAAYDARFKDAKPATEYNAAHILVATEDEAKAVKAELDGGAEFAAVAGTKSTDSGSAVNGGDLGWFGPGMMVKPFEDAVMAAEVGKVTDPVQSDFGWHVILVKESRQAAQPTLEEMRPELAAEVEQKAIEAHLADLTAKATITRPGDALDPALLRKDELLAD